MLFSVTATSQMRLFEFKSKLIKIKLKTQFLSHTSHNLKAQQTHVTSGYHIAQHRYRIFSSLWKVPICEVAPVGELIYPRFYG